MLVEIGKRAQQAAAHLARLSSAAKNRALSLIDQALQAQQTAILQANQYDVLAAQRAGLSAALQDRLLLTPQRLAALSQDLQQVIHLADPLAAANEPHPLASDLQLTRRRVAIGVIGVIYEARPNVTVDVTMLCLKSGNAVILRGGKETQRTNQILVSIIQQALALSEVPAAAVQLIESADRAAITALLRLERYVDMIVTRGGASLHQLCREQATIPLLSGGIGVCHLFVEATADQPGALSVINNAKVQRPSACNALETLLVQQAIAELFLPKLSANLAVSGVTLHACQWAAPLLAAGPAKVVPICPEDYDREWLSLDLNVCVVADLDAAITHIRHHGSGHSEGILTQQPEHATRFTHEVNAAAVYINASTRFTDGGQFGLGAEMAISTQKLHVRGPVGLEALTTYQWVGQGDYLIRD